MVRYRTGASKSKNIVSMSYALAVSFGVLLGCAYAAAEPGYQSQAPAVTPLRVSAPVPTPPIAQSFRSNDPCAGRPMVGVFSSPMLVSGRSAEWRPVAIGVGVCTWAI
jgi:hypothetical protein